MKEVLETINFDGVTAGSADSLPDGYDGFHWNSVFVTAASVLDTADWGPNGYVNDLHSGDSVAYYKGGGSPMFFSADRNFRLVDGYFAAGWDDHLRVEFNGYRDRVEVAHKVVFLDINSRLIHFGGTWRDLDNVSISVSGGVTDPNTKGAGQNLVIEDLKVKAPPFPTQPGVHHDVLDHHVLDHAPVTDTFVV